MSAVPILPGCETFAPMEPPKDRGRNETRQRGDKGKSSGRFPALNDFVDCTMQELSRAEIAVWLILFRDTKADGTARTGQADIARRAGASTRTVIAALHKLEGNGLVEVIRRGGINRGPSVYRVHSLVKLASP